MRKGQTLNKQHHAIEIKLQKDVKAALIAGSIARAVKVNVADVGILGLGFWLGFVMDYRPGLTLPGGFFLGLPDFGDQVKRLREDVKKQEKIIASLKRSATIITRDADCVAFCEEARRIHARAKEPFDFQACLKDCESETATLTPAIEAAEAKLPLLKAELLKHRIAQGALMSLMAMILTRNLGSILQGIGEIIPG